jgi:hypothetical protein
MVGVHSVPPWYARPVALRQLAEGGLADARRRVTLPRSLNSLLRGSMLPAEGEMHRRRHYRRSAPSPAHPLPA